MGPPAVAAAKATATITFSNVSAGDSVHVGPRRLDDADEGTITCNAASSCSTLTNQTARNNRMATLVADSIAARSGITGIAASQAATP